MNSCLIVIDVQESFRHRPFFTEQDLGTYLQAQNPLIAGAQAQGIPIVRVFHSSGPAQANTSGSPSTGSAGSSSAASAPSNAAKPPPGMRQTWGGQWTSALTRP